ncbi:MAG: ammonia-forming cytochrome c nitrite reductase subunit c552 [gamma proteobacterium symbiont of Bathyaustriella thionipta]|nr:ammonia-forming cytochrome c nitrite reductase subunit c552 [gamma proteobacterium symbiont of Bathyaustriella thionipta]
MLTAIVALMFILFSDTVRPAEYIGAATCESCHAKQAKAWQGSPHDLAMQEANESTVLGDFNNQQFEQFGVKSRFFRKGKDYWVSTDGPDGKLHDYKIAYTFGVNPLQQYLIKFPKGRLQVLDIAWDSRPQQAGGQRWFHLHPDDKVTHDDILHWTGPNLNWNYMCADCHSTHLIKNFNARENRYNTRWSEIDVSCEACHGPGSEHKKWADNIAAGKEYKIQNKGLSASLNERKNIHWIQDPKTGKPRRSQPNNLHHEIQVCARCHSRRSQLSDDFIPGQPFMNAYHPSLLTEGLYYADGQMRDEVYVWGSFQQSKMFQQGVTCSDCHDPHKATLKLPAEQVCYQCHSKDHYATSSHHFHKTASEGSSCIECHMPATTFMGVDRRHDHAFRIPRPASSMRLGTPNACNQCHRDKTALWAAQQVNNWYGQPPQGHQQFAPALAAARADNLSAEQLLLKLAMNKNQPAIARATALSEFNGGLDQARLMPLQQTLNDNDALIRLGALDAIQSLPVQQHILAFPLVWDEVRSVRIEAARLMAAYPATDKINAAQQSELQNVT